MTRGLDLATSGRVLPVSGRSSVPLRVLIVDDEPIARQVLRDELEIVPGVQIAGEAENGEEALAEIARSQPDLVLLDLQMPGLGGFDVIRRLPESPVPIVVVVTAYNEHAIRAFEAGALDYLLKPVSRERLGLTLDRARALLARKHDAAESLVRLSDIEETPAAPRNRRVVGRIGEEYFLLNLDDVLAFQAERETVWIMTPHRRYAATHTLREIAGRLGESQFQRVHRNALVNVNHVRKMAPISSQRWLLTLSNGQEFTVSKRQAHAVRQIVQW
jgi:two-component system, LytTR family, response regulator